MKNGLIRFTFCLDKIKSLMNEAREQENPALWLFKNDARTPFFMLEGLAKLYMGIQNPKKFGKLKDQFKLIEDGLGQIDYYNWLFKAIQSNKQIPTGFHQFIKIEYDQRAAMLNELLKDKDWLSPDNIRIIKITKKLKDIKWLKPNSEVKAVSEFYKKSINEINQFVGKTNFHFENVEKDVHELRRKLRWLSIYPQALQGLLQYDPESTSEPHLDRYLTQEIINSPFNKLPDAENNTAFVLLNKNYFLALSWIIAQLGILKDEGLLLIGLSEAIMKSKGCTKEEALVETYTLLGQEQHKMKIILDNADVITKTFFKEKNLDHLISKISKVQKQ